MSHLADSRTEGLKCRHLNQNLLSIAAKMEFERFACIGSAAATTNFFADVAAQRSLVHKAFGAAKRCPRNYHFYWLR